VSQSMSLHYQFGLSGERSTASRSWLPHPRHGGSK
jgi:hypothetical protein